MDENWNINGNKFFMNKDWLRFNFLKQEPEILQIRTYNSQVKLAILVIQHDSEACVSSPKMGVELDKNAKKLNSTLAA